MQERRGADVSGEGCGGRLVCTKGADATVAVAGALGGGNRREGWVMDADRGAARGYVRPGNKLLR
jgi:hypothetical protein